MVFGKLCIGLFRARSTTASCTWRKGTPVAPAVGMRAAEHWLFAYRTASLGAVCAPPKGSKLGMVLVVVAWPGYLLATCTRRIRAALTPCAWFRLRLQWFAALWADFAGLGCGTSRAQPHRFVFGVVRALVWPLYFLANCTRWIGAALTPRARCRCWFQRRATLWANFGGCCL